MDDKYIRKRARVESLEEHVREVEEELIERGKQAANQTLFPSSLKEWGELFTGIFCDDYDITPPDA